MKSWLTNSLRCNAGKNNMDLTRSMHCRGRSSVEEDLLEDKKKKKSPPGILKTTIVATLKKTHLGMKIIGYCWNVSFMKYMFVVFFFPSPTFWSSTFWYLLRSSNGEFPLSVAVGLIHICICTISETLYQYIRTLCGIILCNWSSWCYVYSGLWCHLKVGIIKHILYYWWYSYAYQFIPYCEATVYIFPHLWNVLCNISLHNIYLLITQITVTYNNF